VALECFIKTFLRSHTPVVKVYPTIKHTRIHTGKWQMESQKSGDSDKPCHRNLEPELRIWLDLYLSQCISNFKHNSTRVILLFWEFS